MKLSMYFQEVEGQKTNNGIHYRLQLLYANGMLYYFIFLHLIVATTFTTPSPPPQHPQPPNHKIAESGTCSPLPRKSI